MANQLSSLFLFTEEGYVKGYETQHCKKNKKIKYMSFHFFVL
jgi:hypothetical protein